MGLTVGIGLADWFFGTEEQADHEALLRELVGTGCTSRVRDFVGVTGRGAVDLASAMYEAWKDDDGQVCGRYLEVTERAPIVEDLLAVYEEWGTYAGFSWDHLEEVGAWDVQTLNVLMDVDDTREFVAPAMGENHRIRDLRDSVSNWEADDPQCAIALTLCRVARKHRLVIKSI